MNQTLKPLDLVKLQEVIAVLTYDGVLMTCFYDS